MSRNLCQSNCRFCGCPNITMEEAPRPITKDDAGGYFPEYEGMLVANAYCSDCEAKYLAWVDGSKRTTAHQGYGYDWPRYHESCPVGDLSFRSTFDDEPGAADYPKWKMVRAREPWPLCACGAPEDDGYCTAWPRCAHGRK